MSLAHDIIRLYSKVLFQDIWRHSISDDDMRAAISDMQKVYMPEKNCLTSTARRLANYNSPAHRCAYLHKYAPFHTAMVFDVLLKILKENSSVYWAFRERISLIQTRQQKFKLCSLGGGPGSDIVGILTSLFQTYDLFCSSANIVDIKSDWKDTVTSVVNELRFGMCGSLLEQGFKTFNFEYLTADLLENVKEGVKLAVESADLISMVKFVSAAACESTEWMIKKVFTMMKPGAFVLFIDNAAGGFRELVNKAATDCNLTSVCGPISYQIYTNDNFSITHWGHTSCHSTTVTIHMLQRLLPCPILENSQPKTKVNSNLESKKLANTIGNGCPIENKLQTPRNNGKPVGNKFPLFPTPVSNGNCVPNIPPTTNGNKPIPSKNNGKPALPLLSTPVSNGNLIPNKPPTPNGNDKPIPCKNSVSEKNGKPKLTLLPTPANNGYPIPSIPPNGNRPIPSKLRTRLHSKKNGKPKLKKRSIKRKSVVCPLQFSGSNSYDFDTNASNGNLIAHKLSPWSSNIPKPKGLSSSSSYSGSSFNQQNQTWNHTPFIYGGQENSGSASLTHKSGRKTAEVRKFGEIQNVYNGPFWDYLPVKSDHLVGVNKFIPESICHQIPPVKKMKYESIQNNVHFPMHKVDLREQSTNNGFYKPNYYSYRF